MNHCVFRVNEGENDANEMIAQEILFALQILLKSEKKCDNII